MHLIDYAIILIYFIFSFGIAIYYSKRAGKSTQEFFLSGRNLPWYLCGLSMVATTFAADTPFLSSVSPYYRQRRDRTTANPV